MKLIASLALLFALALPAAAQEYTTVTSNNALVDNGSGTAVNPPSGSSLCFLGVNNQGAAITYTPSGGSPVTGTVCQTYNGSGALTGTLQVANPATATPYGLCYAITIINGGTTYLSIPTVCSISGSLFSLDSFALTGNGSATGIGYPHLSCNNGATWTSTTLPSGQDAETCNSAGSWIPYPPNNYCPAGMAYNTPQSGGRPFCSSPLLANDGAPSGPCLKNSFYSQQDSTAVYYCQSGSWALISGDGSGGLTSFQGRTTASATLQASDLTGILANSPFGFSGSQGIAFDTASGTIAPSTNWVLGTGANVGQLYGYQNLNLAASSGGSSTITLNAATGAASFAGGSASISASGVATLAASSTVGGEAVCLTNGTNCPTSTAGTNYQTVQNNTTPVTERAVANYITTSGIIANDDSGNASTDISLAGIPNSSLANSCITINNTSSCLGGNVTLPSDMVYPGAGVPNSTGTAWGTSYTVGTGDNDLVQLNSSGALPAISGANLTGVDASELETDTWEAPGTIGSTTPNTGDFTILSAIPPTNTVAVDGQSTGASGVGILGTNSINGVGVEGSSNTGYGGYFASTGGVGLYTTSIVDSSLTAGTAAVCPDGASNILVNTGCTAANLSGTPALPSGTTATTQTTGDNSTLIATDAFVLANATGLTVGTTAITSGTTGHVEYDDSGVLGELPITGSGSVVLSTSPTLVTPALGTPSSGVITDLTGTCAACSANKALNLVGAVQYSVPYQSSGATTSYVSPQTTTGTYFYEENVTSSAAVAPTLSPAATGTGAPVLAASPALTGAPTAPTATAGTDTTQIATTAFVLANAVSLGGSLTSANVALGAGAGTGATLTSINGLDGSFQIAFTSGTTPVTAADILTVTFTASRGHVAYCSVVPLSWANLNDFAEIPYQDGQSATQLAMKSDALGSSTSYQLTVQCP